MMAGSKSVGHPVDVATGSVYFTRHDYWAHGKIPLVWDLFYSSTASDKAVGSLGNRWTNRYFSHLSKLGNLYSFTGPFGEQIEFVDEKYALEAGGILYNFSAFHELSKSANSYIVTSWNPDTGDIERFHFHIKGNQISKLAVIEDHAGHSLDLIYDSTGALAGIRQRREQRSLKLNYTNEGLIESLTFVAADRATYTLCKYQYDKSHRLVAATNVLGGVTSYQYDSDSRILLESRSDGGAFTFEYDANGRCVKTSGVNNYDYKRLVYSDITGWTEVTDSLGNISRYHCTHTSQIDLELNPLGGTTATQFDEHARVIRKTDPEGNVTQFEYDSEGNRCASTNALGHRFEVIYQNHLPIELKDHSGQSWKRYYDAKGRLLRSRTPSGVEWSYTYNDEGDLISITDPLGAQKVQHFTSDGVLYESSDWAGAFSRYITDAFGNVTALLSASGELTRYSYDLAGNIVAITYADGTKLTRVFDGAGNLIRTTDCDGHSTFFRYGSCRRLVEHVDAGGNRTRYRWGTEPNQLLSIENAKHETYSIFYDACGRRKREIGFDGRETSFTYNKADRCISQRNGLGHEVFFSRDALGRIISRKASDETDTEISYDSNGYVISAKTPDAAISYERDEFGRVIREIQSDCILKRTWDRVGLLRRMESSFGCQLDMEYDPNGRVNNLVVNGCFRYSFERDGDGNEKVRTLPGGLKLNSSYDRAGRLKGQTVISEASARNSTRHFSAGTAQVRALVERQYSFSGSNSLVSMADGSAGQLDYTYNALEQLTSVQRAGGESERFEYDSLGNVSRCEDGNGSRYFEYLSGSRVAVAGDVKFEYDAQGRLIRKTRSVVGKPEESWTFSWDSCDQLRSVVTPDGSAWKYGYDALGRRSWKSGPDGTVRFVWDNNSILHQVDHGSAFHTSTSWINEPHRLTPLCKIEQEQIYSVIADHLGTPRELVSDTGTVVWGASYKAWGKLRTLTANKIDCPFRFQGQYADNETGLHYNRFRYYDPDLGRYISQDPIRLIGGLNSYAYAWNPINWLDPFGLIDDPATRYQPGDPVADNEIIVMGGGPGKGREPLRPGVDDRPLPGVSTPGKSASIATDMTVESEIPQMFNREPNRGDVITAAFAGDIRSAGFDVVYAPTDRNPRHVRIVAKGSQFDPEGGEALANALEEKGAKIKRQKKKDPGC